LKVLQRIGRVKGFSPSGYDGLAEKNSFCLSGNSNGIEFLIYDLERLLSARIANGDASWKKIKDIKESSSGMLRAEMRLTKPKTIRSYTDNTCTSEQIAELSNTGRDIFFDTFTRIIPFGDFYKKDKALEIIREKIKDQALRRRMIRLVSLIPEKKSLHLAQKEMGCRNIDEVMEAFAKIGLSPITISKRHDAKHLKNLYEFIKK
jgi:hypothetical protein